MFIYSKDSKYHLTSELLSLQSFKRTFTLPSQALRDLYHEICERARRPSGGVLQMEMVVVLPNPFVDTRFLSPAAESKKNVFFFFVKIGKGKESQRHWKCTYFLSYTLRYPAVYGSHFLENVSGYWVPIPLRKRILKTGHGYRINHGKPKLPCIRSHTFLA